MKYIEKESSTVELKREMPKNDQIIKTVIGFCNHHGGKIVIGVSNSGTIVGMDQKKIEQALESLDKTIYESCFPTIIPRIYTQYFGKKSILIIGVSSGMNKPYYRKSKGLDKGTYVRLGRSTMIANADMIEELRLQSNGINFEDTANYRAKKKDLNEKDIEFFLSHRKNHAKTLMSDSMLRAYHLIILEHSKFYPTQAALLLFGKNPQYFLSEAMIICSYFQGISGRNAIASIDVEGVLFNQFQQAYNFILSRLFTSFKIKNVKREEKLEIPKIAVREALLNAIVHRNYFIKAPIKISIYDNRVEIFSPGSFPRPLDQNNLKSGITYLRNPIICKIFREAGYIEKLGTGLITIFESYEKRGLQDPKVFEGENYIKVILPRTFKKKSIETEDYELNKLFAFSDEVSIADAKRILEISRSTASRKMNKWLKKGLIKRFGKTRSIHYKKNF